MKDDLQLSMYILGGSIVFLLLAVLVIIFLFRVQRNNQLFLFEKRQLTLEFQQILLQSQLEIREQTLKTISQEIHDNIGQALTLAKLNISTILFDVDEQTRQKMVTSKDLVAKAIGDLRDLSRSLDTDYVVDMGLQRAIEYELELVEKTSVIEAKLEVQGQVVRLDKQKELILFRIIQEAFQNIIKHSNATKLEVLIAYSPKMLQLQIVDNGKGIDFNSLGEGGYSKGLGIRNMHSRVNLIGAELKMESTLDIGTKIEVSVSLENNQHENV